MNKIALFPGSFDPITKGHYEIIKRAENLFDEIVIAIGVNKQKQNHFTLDQRLNFLNQLFSKKNNIKITQYEGLTVEFCEKINANYIIRGLRNTSDFEFEKSIAQMNKAMNTKVETIFLMTSPAFSAISSTIVRDILKHGGDITEFLPEGLKIN